MSPTALVFSVLRAHAQALQSARSMDADCDVELSLPSHIIGTMSAKAELAQLTEESLLYYDAYRGCVSFPFPTALEGLLRTEPLAPAL